MMLQDENRERKNIVENNLRNSLKTIREMVSGDSISDIILMLYLSITKRPIR